MPKARFAVSKKLEENLEVLKEELGYGVTFDLVFRRLRVAHKQACLIFFDGFIQDEAVIHILRALQAVPRMGVTLAALQQDLENVIPYFEMSMADSLEAAMDQVLSGAMLLLIDGVQEVVVLDVRQYVVRGSEEPTLEKVTRGSRDGFVETALFNINLIRRRIRDPQLRFEALQVGRRSKTDVMVGYIEDVADPSLVNEVKSRIEAIDRDAIPMGGKNLEEYILGTVFNPLPVTRYTERPDVAAAKILEGRVAVLVDGSPFALTMPYLLVEAFQANEDYYNHWMVASFHRLIRYISFFITTSTPAIYIALISYHPQLIPTNLVVSISAARKNVPFPGIVEVIIMGLVFEILREGGVRLPRPIGQAVSIVGAIVLGEAAVSASLVSAPMIIVVGLTGVAGFVNPWLNDIAVLFRLLFVVLASVLGLYGYVLGVIAVVLLLSSMESFGVPYLSTMTTLVPQDIKDTLLRVPWWQMTLRPRYLASKDRQRLQGRGGRGS
ncbi:MAG TPA: spore germination protein [Firmicutes bacterium]|nr:spore germination protein [Bacillota bacterium]